ncbi:putative hydrolase YbfO [Paenibacillus albidus]|uniref:Hydrolase YbfO n=1 Tax=Paenibacillus albidus TaxID=2041023 RepID=A0A917D6X5_9BACL|nr:erythromycin esterase family protein [Paenibacillus albidus]GGG11877.1 putative hydrolase YbfO [Paenibacillus albidus]
MSMKSKWNRKVIALLSALLVLLPSQSASAGAAPPSGSKLPGYAHEIKSLKGEDYSDLAYLKPLLAGKTVVSLGENFHRVAEYASLKTKMIKYLHEELGFDVIAFESGLGDAEFINKQSDQLNATEMMKYSVLPVWHSKETLELFNYIKKSHKTDKPLELAGFDNQFTSPMLTYGVSDFISTVNKEYGKAFISFDFEAITEFYVIMNKYGLHPESEAYKRGMKQVIQRYVPQYKQYTRYIKERRELFTAAYPADPYLIDVVLKSLEDRVQFLQNSSLVNVQQSYEARDRAMAEHVEWLMKVRYPGKKIILWAHNDHLAKNTSDIRVLEGGKWINSFTSMGELLHQKLKDKMYVVGFFMNRGKTVSITNMKEFSIGPMPKGSLEQTLLQTGHKNIFVDLSRHTKADVSNSWMFKPVYAAEDGMTSEVIVPMSMKFVPKEQFDGLIVVDRVNTPTPAY